LFLKDARYRKGAEMLELGTTGLFTLRAGCRRETAPVTEHVPSRDGVICTRNHQSVLQKRGWVVLVFFRIKISFGLGWRSGGVGRVMGLSWWLGARLSPALFSLPN